jgi:hypothetical protein
MRSRPRRPLRYVCLFAYNNVQHILCCVFVFVFFFVCVKVALNTITITPRLMLRYSRNIAKTLASISDRSRVDNAVSGNNNISYDVCFCLILSVTRNTHIHYCLLNVFPTSIITRVIFSPTTSMILS